ncbi:MAG: ABC transporter permease [Nitrospirota bacterium]|nr:ABC transporter permease [Nitrospirota bacterium]MDH5767681.1 ABC transporter permease [Nitrospirota bacterium]
MDIYAVRILKSQPLRLILTIGGVSLCVILMLFLLAVYQGVADGSVEYIRKNCVDLWVLQSNATNILRGSSLVSAPQEQSIRQIPGVKSVSLVLLVLSTVKKGDKARTIFLTGFDPKDGIGGPPQIIAGRSIQGDNEIVLDKSFASKFKFTLGDSVKIQEHMLKVVGISSGTNALVIQYAFVTLHFAQKLMGFPGIATCFLVQVKDINNIDEVANEIRNIVPGIEVYDHKTFLENNIQEMESGFLPLLYTVALIGAVVLTVILSLLLSVNILERKKDFAVLKTLGSPPGFLKRIIIVQALLISFTSSIVALIIFFPLVKVIERISPEVTTKLSVEQILAVISVVAAMSLISSFISMQKLRRIYLLEVFK